MDRRERQIAQFLESCRLGRPLIMHAELGSTNDQLKGLAVAGAPEGCTVMADHQISGRGRQGRSWLSLPGKGLYLSVLLRPPWTSADTILAGILGAVTVARILEDAGLRHASVKWPNDVLVDGHKIAGVLVEPRVSQTHVAFIVMGFGLNVRHDRDDLKPLGEGVATSCRLEGVSEDIDAMAVRLLKRLDVAYARLLHKGSSDLMADWAARQAPAPREPVAECPAARS